MLALQYDAAHALVTSSQLIPALGKCMLYGLDSFFPVELIVSARPMSKTACFRQLMKRCVRSDDDVRVCALKILAVVKRAVLFVPRQWCRLHLA